MQGAGNVEDVTSTSIGEVVYATSTMLTVKMITGEFVGNTDSPFSTSGWPTGVTVTAAAQRAITAGNDQCNKESQMEGEWVTDIDGPVNMADLEKCEEDDQGNPTECKLNYFCGMVTDVAGTAMSKLMANGGTVWNVYQLGCTADSAQRWLCDENTKYDNKFLIRSLAGQDANGDGAISVMDYECLYFPQIAGGEYTHPRRAPKSPSEDGRWGGLMADGDGNGDNECGIMAMEGETQEEALVANKQATWTLIPLPDF